MCPGVVIYLTGRRLALRVCSKYQSGIKVCE
jgi:hypothetical protein